MNLIRRPFRYSFFYATIGIIIANAFVFLLTSLYPRLQLYLGLSVRGVIGAHFWWQPVTYMFTHGGFTHILFNMFGVLCFGLPLERAIGSKEFLLFYFVCGILDGLLTVAIYFFTGYYSALLIGASGALYSVLLAYAVIFPRSIISIWGIIPVPAPILVLGYALIEFFSQFVGSTGVAHMAHLLGLAFGWLYLLVRMNLNPIRVWKEAWRR